jgi:hypothetical protein
MLRTFILGAAAAAAIGLTAAAPAQARMADPALGVTAPNNVEQAQYYRRHHSWRRHYGWRRGYAWHPRRCWTERIRTWNGHVRFVRRCR